MKDLSNSVVINWIRVASCLTILTGLLASLASRPETDALWRFTFDLLKGFNPDRATHFDAASFALNAVLGGVMIGWGTMMLMLSSYITKSKHICKIYILSLLVWFVCDSVGSILANLLGNCILNVAFLVMYLPPLVSVYRRPDPICAEKSA